jgi:hypothetical protein
MPKQSIIHDASAARCASPYPQYRITFETKSQCFVEYPNTASSSSNVFDGIESLLVATNGIDRTVICKDKGNIAESYGFEISSLREAILGRWLTRKLE